MSPAESVEVTVEPDPHEVFQPLKSMLEVTLETLNASYVLTRFAEKSSVLKNLAAYKGEYINKTSVAWSEDPVVEKAIKFRRYADFPTKLNPEKEEI